MGTMAGFLAGCVLVLMAPDVGSFSRSGRRGCSVELRSRTTSYLASHVEPVYQPYLTLCQGYRLCSKYRTTYKATQRPAYREVSQAVCTCCPRWKWGAAPQRLGCNIGCRSPCQNGGSPFLNQCSCAPGWTGRFCQTDVDECAGGSRHGCSQVCLNMAGSYRCGCRRGYKLQADGKACQVSGGATGAPPAPDDPAGNTNRVLQDDVKELKIRMAALEERFQRAMAPFLKADLPEGATRADPLGLLAHSLQQLERIESLSEQISFLEERLETCSCKNER